MALRSWKIDLFLIRHVSLTNEEILSLRDVKLPEKSGEFHSAKLAAYPVLPSLVNEAQESQKVF